MTCDTWHALNTRPKHHYPWKQEISPPDHGKKLLQTSSQSTNMTVTICIAYMNMQMSTPSYVPVLGPRHMVFTLWSHILHLVKPANQHQGCLQVGLIVYKHHALFTWHTSSLNIHQYLHLYILPEKLTWIKRMLPEDTCMPCIWVKHS